jgi:radical SAM superfamily enzyme YgiQ (UPF0313 family)
MKLKILFIMPAVGRKPGQPYVKSWKMEPLPIATLAALTPEDRFIKYFADDRLEPIPFDLAVDAVAITTETYTARRAYQIADRFRKQNIPVILGGFHATLMPQEAAEHADAVLVGEAEGCWENLLDDLAAGTLKTRYENRSAAFSQIFPERDIYAGRKYINLAMLETSRGCRYKCEFCSITAFFKQHWTQRPVSDVVHQIRSSQKKNWFFVDDNIGTDIERFEKLLVAITPLRIRWVGQISIEITKHSRLLKLMHKSGCIGVLIGFESINTDNLIQMGKGVNRSIADYESAIGSLRRSGLAVYGTFVFGYDHDTHQSFEDTFRFAIKNKLFFAAFNHLVPFPGTALYERLLQEKRLIYKNWWLEENYRFGEIAFHPKNFTPDELTGLCLEYRRKFYSFKSIISRGNDYRANCRTPFMAALFYSQNVGALRDINLRQNLPLGIQV